MIPCKPTGFAVILRSFIHFKSHFFYFFGEWDEKKKRKIKLLTIKIVIIIKARFNENHRIKGNKNVKKNHSDGQKKFNRNRFVHLEIRQCLSPPYCTEYFES